MTNEERIRHLLATAEKFDGLADIKRRIANREQRRKERKEKLKELMTNETKQQLMSDWLQSELERIDKEEYYESIEYINARKKAFQQAKEMEKEQIEDAYSLSRCKWNETTSSSEYYNETYGGNK